METAVSIKELVVGIVAVGVTFVSLVAWTIRLQMNVSNNSQKILNLEASLEKHTTDSGIHHDERLFAEFRNGIAEKFSTLTRQVEKMEDRMDKGFDTISQEIKKIFGIDRDKN